MAYDNRKTQQNVKVFDDPVVATERPVASGGGSRIYCKIETVAVEDFVVQVFFDSEG